MALNVAGMVVVITLLHRILMRRRADVGEAGYARQVVSFESAVDWTGASPLDETLHTAPCPYAETCDRTTCKMEGTHGALAAEGGFGDPICAKCGETARLIESKLVAVPAEWRGLVRFADAVACDRCGFVNEGEVPFISLDPRLRNDDQMMKAAIGAAARELARRVVECDRLGHIHNLNEGTE